MSLRFSHKCIACDKTFSPDRFLYTCPVCDNLLMVERDEDYIKKSIGTGQKLRNYIDNLRYGPARQDYPNDSGVWLWRDLVLPGFPTEHILSLKEGQTDLFEVPEWLRKELGINELFIKLEGQGPSESFKDRGMAVAVSDVLRLQATNPELGIEGISCASTGDTSASAAVYAAYVRDRLRCLVLLPFKQISDAQLFQAMMHGANVRAIKHPDGFDGCMKLIQEFTASHPELALVNSKNDMRLIGQETIGLEILQDLRWQTPDWIAIPVGNGGNLTALLIAMLRARDHGLITKLPGIIAAQTEVSDTLARWQKSDYQDYEPKKRRDTIASAMNINDPVSFPRIKKLYDNFDIHFYSIPEDMIKDEWMRFTSAGANVCPQTATALSAVQLARQENTIKRESTVVVISTASSVKFSDSGIEYHKSDAGRTNPYVVVDGTVKALEDSL